MSKRLLICESPGKVRKLSQILGSDWIVKASMGHIRELSDEGEDSLGFTMQASTVKCHYIPRGQRGQDTIKQLQAAVKQVDTVILATDGDREGEIIGWHLQQVLNLKNPQRVVYSEITATAVQAAIANPRAIDMNLVKAGLARDCLDKLVGYRGSPLLWLLNNGAKSLGRVQSPTLHLVCQREREIQAFVPQDYWNVWVEYAEGFRAFYCGMATNAGETAESQVDTDDDAADNTSQVPESTRVLSQAEAERLVQEAQRHPHQVIQVEGKITNRQPPAPFTTSTMQQAAGSKLRFSPEQTMKVAQSLYEAGLISYMRTDSVELSPEFCVAARQWLEQHDPQNVPGRIAKHRSSKNAQEAHEAIRPTDLTRPSKQLKVELATDEFDLYVLIWKRALASQCQPARLRKTRVLTRSGLIFWQARGQVVEFLGYAKYWKNLSDDSELPVLQQSQLLSLKQAGHEQKQTQPPPRYSEPKLVQTMERSGIGRPSTYAGTIQTLKQRQYIQLLKGSLQPTKLGLEVDEFLAKVLPNLLESGFTASMEQTLDAIAAGQQDWQQYLTSWNRDYFAPALDQARKLIASQSPGNSIPASERQLELSKEPCPQCSQPLAKVPSNKVSKKYFLKCVNGCSDVVLFWSDYRKQWGPPRPKNNEPTTTTEAPSVLAKPTSFPCPVCKQTLEEYNYTKDGQQKKMLRCSSPKARNDKRHQGVVFFESRGVWWSREYGELPLLKQ